MCTVISLTTAHTYVGRNLDLEYRYREEVVHTPRHFPLSFRCQTMQRTHYAMLGTAYVPETFPLYYDAVNEHGLYMAGLNFPQYAQYASAGDGAIAPFEVIPFVLAQCRTVRQACDCLRHTPIARIDYNDRLPCTPLHWFLADREECVAAEPTADGLLLTPDPIGVLTNSPPLPFHLANLARYTSLTPQPPHGRFGNTAVSLYSRGMGTEGLPGGYSSTARFVRAAYGREHSRCDISEVQSVMQMFHLLDSVAHPRGSVVMPDGRYEITVYSSCCDLCTGMYYYKTYDSGCLCAVGLEADDRNASCLFRYAMEDVFTPHSPYPFSDA